ncbi:MAG: helix-turn-helix transcriptional regulator [Pseudomonadales bacterium]|nr:helix-turn-helix transcriptional regulator [Pseudomonadales bacterium]HMY00520.1 helix-turn-helix transcriptional regulator [Agitococcus sp.]HNC03935.1 helix-turn-helix transcriptional regulator [Agitococcus sp.]
MKEPVAMTTYPAVVGAILIARRKELGLSQNALAESVGLTVSTWSRIENGDSALTIEQLKLAGDKLNVLPSQILKEADEKIIELKNRGIETNPVRVSINEIHASGIIPLVGTALFGLISTPLVLAAASVTASAVVTKLAKKFED